MHPFRVFACAGAPLLIRLCPVQVKRCDEMLRKLRFFGEQIAKADLVALPRTTREKAYELDELEVKLEELERELLEVNGNVEKLRRSHRCARDGVSHVLRHPSLTAAFASQRADGAAAGA